MPDHPKIADIQRLITLLLERGVQFILVGGAAALAHGAATGTQDVDVVHSRNPENVDRVQSVLVELDAFFRTDLSGRRLTPTREHLEERGQLLLSTSLGQLDLLGALHDGRGYEQLLPHTIELRVGAHGLRVLDVATLIEVKTAAGRTKDKLVVAELIALLDRDGKE